MVVSIGNCQAPPVQRPVKKWGVCAVGLVVLLTVLRQIDNEFVDSLPILAIDKVVGIGEALRDGVIPTWTDLIGLLATTLSIVLSILAAWPYYLIYRKLATLDSAPLKFTYLALGSNSFGLYCGIKMQDPAIINTTRFNLIWLGLCYLLREYCSFSHGDSHLMHVVQRLLNVIAMLLLIVVGIDLINEPVRDIMWVIFQVAPNAALAFDYRKAYMTNNIQGVSLPMLIACILCSLFWVYYGILRESLVLIIPSLSGVIFPSTGFAVYYSLITRKGRYWINKMFFINKIAKSDTAVSSASVRAFTT